MLSLSNQKVLKNSIFFSEEKNYININDLETLVIYKCRFDKTFSDIKCWLKKKSSKLFILEDCLDDLICFFHSKESYDLLKNEKVNFVFLKNIKEAVDQITSSTTTKKIDVLTFVGKNRKYEKIKNEIIQNNLISFFSNQDSLNSFKIFKNFYSNFEKLHKSFLINRLKNKFKDVPAIITGAGPSLKYSLDKLKTLQNKALIIAGGSSITCLTQAGILPHMGVVVDPNFDEYIRIKDSLAFQIPIIYSTRVNRGVFQTLNGPLGYIKAAACSFFEIWLDKQLNIPDKYLFNKLEEKALSVTTICIRIAKLFGCNPIILDGVDLAYSEDKLYALDIIENNNTIQKDEEIKQNIVRIKDKNGSFVNSNLNWQIERFWFNYFAKSNKNKKFLNATKYGLKIDAFTDMCIDEIEKKYLNKQFDLASHLHVLMEQNKIINPKNQYDDLKKNLKKSFENTISLLSDIIKNKPEYKAILAKEDLFKEDAYQFFLLNASHTLNKFYKEELIYKKLKESAGFFLKQMKK
ncbi:MAG: 6-hydroxymethylpterin diphosphokinase MptE-like protein [Parachlamydiales bacterium]